MTTPGPDWVEQARRFAAGLAAEHAAGTSLSDALGGLLGAANTATPPADHSAECRWCPVCTGLAALRGRRPDLLEALADVLTTAATTLRAQAATPHPAPGGSDAAAGAPAPAASEPDAAAPPEKTVKHPAPVQRIDVA